MISYGLTMQGKPDKVPAEVAVWLLERNELYPNIKFTIEVDDVAKNDASQREELRVKYARLFGGHPTLRRPMGTTFLYPHQNWYVRIVGGLDEDGNIADMTQGHVHSGLSPELRREITEMPEDAELISIDTDNESWATFGKPFKNGESPLEGPTEYILMEADERWSSELTMSAAEIVDIIEGPYTERKEALARAISDKDWETARQLLKQRH